MYNIDDNAVKFTVTAQEGPGIVIAHPGQDVELLCNVTVTSTSEAVEWIVDHEGQHGVNALLNNILPGYSTNGNNLIVENIMMNDGRNDSEYRCVIILQSTSTMQRESDLTTLYVAGEYHYHCKPPYLHTYLRTYIRTYMFIRSLKLKIQINS